MRRCRVLSVLAIGILAPAVVGDVVKFKWRGQTMQREGNVLGQFADGGIRLECRDSRHFDIAKTDLLQWQRSEGKLPPYNKGQLQAHLTNEFGPRFKLHWTRNYVVVYDCSASYAQWTGQFLERTHELFVNYFHNLGGFRFVQPVQPMIAVVYADRDKYLKGISDIVENRDWTAGVFTNQTNRIYMYEPAEGSELSAKSKTTPGRSFYSSPAGKEFFDIVVHEGVHQIAYNLGFHNRYAFNPTWFVEGMATFFQHYDPRNQLQFVAGNHRLERFIDQFDKLPSGFLMTLVVSDEAFQSRDANTIADAYSRSWAFTYFLVRARAMSYSEYIRILNERPLTEYTPEERLADFRKAFGKDPVQLEADFRRYMAPIVTAVRRSRTTSAASGR